MEAKLYVCISLVTLLSISVYTFGNERCHSEKDTLKCHNFIPSTVHSSITKFYLMVNRDIGIIEASRFADRSWEYVHVFDVTAQFTGKESENFSLYFERRCFYPLSGLRQLRFHGDRIMWFSIQALYDNAYLELLEFSRCPWLKCHYFMSTVLLDSHANIRIQNLTLSIVSDASSNHCKLDKAFLDVIIRLRVVNLSLRGSVLLISDTFKLSERPRFLKGFDISEANIVFLGVSSHAVYETVDIITSGLTTINISYIDFLRNDHTNVEYRNEILSSCDDLYHTDINLLIRKAENVHANGVFGTQFANKKVIIDKVFVNMSGCPCRLQTFEFRENYLQWLNISILFPDGNNITKVDFSDNEIIYISPNVLKTANSLKIFLLEKNRLSQMESHTEFNDLLRSFVELKHFSIAENGISRLPFDFFRSNQMLNILDLSRNALETITFDLKYFKYLQVFNLRSNNIHFFEGQSLELIQLYMIRYKNDQSSLQMEGNPFQCSCASVRFVQWTLSLMQSNSSYSHECELDGNYREMDKQALDDAKFLCYRTAIYVGVPVFVVVLVLTIAISIICVLRQRQIKKQKCNRDTFLRKFVNGDLPEKYLCLLSHSSEDDVLVLNVVLPNLKRALTQKVDTPNELICRGDNHFTLGRPVIDEIMRCISVSCVMIYIISNNFCDSNWCEHELREAFEANKPIILILKDKVIKEKMSPLVTRIFDKYTRAKIVWNDGEYVLIPDWESLGESVINLAADNYGASLKLKKRRKIEEIADEAQV